MHLDGQACGLERDLPASGWLRVDAHRLLSRRRFLRLAALSAATPVFDVRLPRGLDFTHLKMRLLVDGALKTEAESSAISGNPVESLVQLLALLRGEELPAGSLVLTGAAAGAEPLSPGQVVELEVTGLAPVCLWAV